MVAWTESGEKRNGHRSVAAAASSIADKIEKECKVKVLATIVPILGLAALTLIAPRPASAQQVQAGAVCMTGTESGRPDGEVITIVIPAAQQSVYEEKGYALAACPASPAALTAYKDRVCQISSPENPLYTQFIEQFRALPNELCSYAQNFIQ